MMSLNLLSEPLGTTPKGLTTSGLSPSRKIEIAPAAIIFSTAEVPKHAWARAEGEFFEILGAGASAIQCSLGQADYMFRFRSLPPPFLAPPAQIK